MLVQAVIGIVNYHAGAEVEVLAGYLSFQKSVERFFGGLEEVQEGFVVKGGQEKEREQYGQRAAALEGFVEQGDGAVKEDFHLHAPECPIDSCQRVVGEYARQVRLEEIEKGEIAGKVAPGVRMQEIVGGRQGGNGRPAKETKKYGNRVGDIGAEESPFCINRQRERAFKAYRCEKSAEDKEPLHTGFGRE